jgi:hypothetical protein
MRYHCSTAVVVVLLLTGVFSARAQKTASSTSPRTVVQALYKAHKQGNGHVFDREGVDKLGKYFDPKLTTLLRKEILGTPSGEVGNLDFDPLYNAQDFDIADFKVGEPQITGKNATVIVSFKNNKQPVKIVFKILHTTTGWRIANLDYGKGENLVKILNAPH